MDGLLSSLDGAIAAAAGCVSLVFAAVAISMSRKAHRLAEEQRRDEKSRSEQVARYDFSLQLMAWFDAQEHGALQGNPAIWDHPDTRRLWTVANANGWLMAEFFIEAVCTRISNPDEPVWGWNDNEEWAPDAPGNGRDFWLVYGFQAREAIWRFGALKSDDIKLAEFAQRHMPPMI